MSSHSDAPTKSKSFECPPEQKPLAVLEYPFSLFSLNRTEMDNEGDEVNSVGQSSSLDTVEVEGYQVRPELESIVRKFIIKHGDVFENCTVSTMIFRSMLLEMICDIISDLQDKNLYEITENKLHRMIGLANDMKDMKVNIEWLQLRLEEILEARQILNQSSMLKEKKHISKKIVETVKRELEECEEEKNAVAAKFQILCDKETACKESLARAEDEL
ncbi:hypothetical protein GmHk_08G022055 [Glycine max]|nr:hypothetical protein GmHk_08G022055 [Glycine max]